jgi:L-fucose isomerase-like protein
MSRPKIGFVACVHPLYDLPRIAGLRQDAIRALGEAGCDVVAAEVPRTPAEAAAIAASLRESGADLAVLFFCTWVSEDIPLALTRELGDAPLFLWALPCLDRDVPMPSPISGVTATASNLRRIGKHFGYAIGASAEEDVARAARAAAAVTALRRARFGLIGAPCPGMIDAAADEGDFRRALGATAVPLELDDLLRAAREAPEEEAVDAACRLVAATGGCAEATGQALQENLRLYAGIRELVRRHELDAYCVRCWPELRDRDGVTPCAAHALMAQDGIPSTCEVDLPALITTWLLARLAGTSAFNFDMTAYLEEDRAIQLAHCGAADPNLAGNPGNALLRTHMRTGTGVTVEFGFKEGPVTLAKLLRPAGGRLRMFVAGGTAISAPDMRGSVAAVRPEPSAAAFLDTVMREGVEHHVALAYGDWRRELVLFSEFTGVEYFAPSGRSL